MKKKTKNPSYFMILIIIIGSFLAILNNSSLHVALPVIMRDLQIENYSTVQWLTTINMLVAGVLMPTSAFFITRFKSHHLFNTAISIFTIGTIFAIIAPNFPLLLVARMIQATGTAIVLPLLMNVLLASFSREQRGKALGIYALIYMLAPVIAPIFSGLIVDNFGWRMIFITIAPFSILILALAFWKLENVLEQHKTSIDVYSVILSTIAFSSILLGFGNASANGWRDISVYGVIFVGVVALLLFIMRQFKIEEPLLDLRVYQYPMFALSSIISVILAMILYSPMIILPYYFQSIKGYSTLQSGLIMLPGFLIMALFMPLSGKMYDRMGALPLALIGFPLIGISSYFMSSLHAETSALYVAVWFLVRSVGIAFVIVPVQTHGLNQLPSRLTRVGTAVNNTLQQVSGAIGTAIFVTLKTNYATTRGTELLHETKIQLDSPLSATVQEEINRQAGLEAINHTSLVTIGFVVVALLLSLFIRKRIFQEENIQKIA